MTCESCGHLLCVDPEKESTLFCPRCDGLPVETDSIVQATTTWLLEDYFTDENIIGLLKEYSKPNLILTLLTRLNHVSNVFFEEEQTGIPVGEFGYLAYILKQVFETDAANFGDKQVTKPRELSEELETIRGAYTELITAFRNARDGFAVCVKRDGYNGRMEDFTSNYELFQSEHGLCFERCTKSILCGDLENYEDYSFVADTLRSTDKTEIDEIETTWDFADAWHQYILQLRLLASSDEMVGDTYYTRLPQGVDIFQISEFLDELDGQFTSNQHTMMKEESLVCALDHNEVNQCGQQAFGDNWDDVKDYLILSQNTPDAHPFLFEIETTEKRMLPGSRRPREVQVKKIVYPRHYARILKFQVFPLLQNGSERTSHEILSKLTADRGTEYERNFYEYLTSNDIHCYHGAEITKSNRNEIDLICVLDDTLTFVEMKYLMPPIRINTNRGTRVLNEKFDRLIFNEVSEDSNREAEGKPFSEKVKAWEELEPGTSFRSQAGTTEKGHESHQVPDEWSGLETRKLVVSNVVPTYVEKEEVGFLTDLEFYQWIENNDESVFYTSS